LVDKSCRPDGRCGGNAVKGTYRFYTYEKDRPEYDGWEAWGVIFAVLLIAVDIVAGLYLSGRLHLGF